MKKSMYIIAAVVILAVGAGAFYGGIKYQQSKMPNSGSRFAGMNFPGGAGGRTRTGQGSAGNGFISGQILSINSGTMTVELPNNSGSKIVLYSDTTPVMKMVSGTPSDLATGANVQIIGASNSDGSISAQTIQLRNGEIMPGQRPAEDVQTPAGSQAP